MARRKKYRQFTMPGGTQIVFSDTSGVVSATWHSDDNPDEGFAVIAEIPADADVHDYDLKMEKLDMLRKGIFECIETAKRAGS